MTDDVELPDGATSRPGRGSPVIRQLAAPVKIGRPAQTIAALGLVGATGGAVAGLVYSVVLGSSSAAESTLGNIALAGVSGLLVLAGVRQNRDE